MDKSIDVTLSLTYDKEGKVNGYEIKPLVDSDIPPEKGSLMHEVMGRIRDMYYHNLDKEVVYNGRTAYPKSSMTKSLKFKVESRKDE